MNTRTKRPVPLPESLDPGAIYDPKYSMNTARRHDDRQRSLHTKPRAMLEVKEPDRQTSSFHSTMPRFQSAARPNVRPTKVVPADYFMLSHRDGNAYRFGSRYM